MSAASSSSGWTYSPEHGDCYFVTYDEHGVQYFQTLCTMAANIWVPGQIVYLWAKQQGQQGQQAQQATAATVTPVPSHGRTDSQQTIVGYQTQVAGTLDAEDSTPALPGKKGRRI